MVISQGTRVKFTYTLNVEGQVIDSAEEAPFEYVHGKGEIIPGLEKELEGMTPGEEKSVTLAPDEGYGQEDPKAFREIPRTQLPPDIKPETGMALELQGTTGKKGYAVVSGVKDDSVILNFNHPLAGKTLSFDIKILDVG